MFIFRRVRNWFFREKPPPKLMNPNIGSAMSRDVGVTVTRIRLPSGGEVVIVEQEHDKEQGGP